MKVSGGAERSWSAGPEEGQGQELSCLSPGAAAAQTGASARKGESLLPPSTTATWLSCGDVKSWVPRIVRHGGDLNTLLLPGALSRRT